MFSVQVTMYITLIVVQLWKPLATLLYCVVHKNVHVTQSGQKHENSTTKSAHWIIGLKCISNYAILVGTAANNNSSPHFAKTGA